jgi:hypothetical protein
VTSQLHASQEPDIRRKRTQSNISSPVEEVYPADHTDSSEEDEFENPSESDSDDDSHMSFGTSRSSVAPLGMKCYFVLIYIFSYTLQIDLLCCITHI